MTARTRRLTGDERREQLLDVTKQLVGEHGFHAVSMEAVAREAGITRPVVYAHFPDRDALLEALLDRETARALAGLVDVLPKEPPQEGSRVEALLTALEGYLEAVRSDPVTWGLVLIPAAGAPAVLRRRIEQGRDAIVALLAELVRQGITPGRESPDPVLTARMLSALADEAARVTLTNPDEFPPERLLRHARWLLTQLG